MSGKGILLVPVLVFLLLAAHLSAQCVQPLTVVGPQKATRNNQVFDHLQILTTTDVPAIDVGGFDGVTITNCWIEHYGMGIYGDGCNDLTIDHCVINCTSAPAAGPGRTVSGSDNATDNIMIYSGTNVHITNVECRDGAHNIAVGDGNVRGLLIQNVNCYSPRGKLSFGGNAIVVGGAHNSTVSDFYCYMSPTTGWSEDLFSIGRTCDSVTVRRGCVDGNNSPTGDGIMIETNSTHITVDSVDVLNQGNGVIGIYSGSVATLKNIRIRGEKTGSYNVGGNIRNVPNGVCLVACSGTMGTLINCLIDKPTILNSCCGYVTSCGMTDFTVAGPNWTTGSYEQIHNGQFTARGPIALTCMPVKNGTSALERDENKSNSVLTLRALPNPSAGQTQLMFNQQAPTRAEISIFNSKGQQIDRLAPGNNAPGFKFVTWNARQHPNGIYFAVLEMAGQTHTSKILLLK